MVFGHPFARLVVSALAAVVVTVGDAAAQGSYRSASLAAIAASQGKTIGQIDTCNNHPDNLTPAPGQSGSVPASCTATAASGPGTVVATSSTNASLSAGGGGGTDRFGRPLFSSISLVVTAKSKVEFKGAPNDPLGGSAGGTAIARIEIVVETGTPYTVTLMPSGNAQLEATMNSVGFTGSVSRTTSGLLDVRLTANSPDVLAPGPGAEIEGTVNVEVTFGSIPPIGACCRASCFVDTSVACNDAAGVFKGGGTTCNPNPCVSPSASPAPSVTPTPSGIIRWINPAGGAYGTDSNWSPPQVPTVNASQADTAVFDLDGEYGLNVAGATAKRFVIRNSSIDLVGGKASVTSTVPTEPSLVIGQNGKLHLVSGTFTSVDSVLGDVSGGLAEVDLIAGTPVWNNTGRLTIGDAGPGRLTIVHGNLTSGDVRIGGGLLGPGEAIVGGDGRWMARDFGLGFGGGSATLEVREDALIISDAGSIGVTADADATVTGGAGWTTGNLAVGRGGVGTLTIEDGGFVISNDAFIGFESTPGSNVTVDGSGAQEDTSWTVNGRLLVGAGPLQPTSDLLPDATLDVVGGGHVVTVDLDVAGKGDGRVSVEGVDGAVPSLIEVSNTVVFGATTTDIGGQGVLAISGGGEVRAKRAKIGGFNFGYLGVVGQDASGEASRLVVAEDLFIGVLDGALVEVLSGGLLESASGSVAAFSPRRNATVFLGQVDPPSAPTSRWRLAGDLDVGSPGSEGSGALVVRRTGEVVVTGAGAVRVLRTGDLSGGGRIQGDVVVMGGRLAPLDPATLLPTRLTIDGDLRVESGTLRINVVGTAPSFYDSIAVSGNATLGGTLEIVFANGFVPQSGDTFPFLQVSGAVSGSFAQVSLIGVQQGLPFSLTPSGLVIGSVTLPPAGGKLAPSEVARANATALVLTTLADGVACAIADTTGDGVAECETCDNCLDDNANQLVDGADPDCVPPADGGGGALAAPAHRKALVGCGKVLRTAAAKLAQGVRTGLTACAAAVATCARQKPDDPTCLPKAIGTCSTKTAKLGTGQALRATFAAKLAKVCGPPALAFDEMLASTGLGFAAASARCARFGVGVLDGIDALTECLAREAECHAAALVSAAVPHLTSLAAAGGVSPDLLACAGDDAAGSRSGNGGGKALRRCQVAIATAAEKLDKAIAGTRERCAGSVLACRQLGADPAVCTAKAAAKCRAGAAKLGDLAAGTGAAGRVAAAIGKACAAVPLTDLLGADGLGFGGQAGECAARGVPALTSPAAVAGCLSRRVECGTGLRLEAATPRLRELLELGQAPLP